jgi:hypothetical protein
MYTTRDLIKVELENRVSEGDCNPDTSITNSKIVLDNAPECGIDFTEVYNAYGALNDWIDTFNCKCGSKSNLCAKRKEFVKSTLQGVLEYVCENV